jgi:hypothetical protein
VFLFLSGFLFVGVSLFLGTCLLQVCLVRVGDFYEAFGADAVLLVEHAGLNPMGGKPRAGCPWRNLQVGTRAR